MKLFLDTNVVLDVLGQRKPWVRQAGLLLSRIEAGEASGFVAAHGITTVYYLLAKWRDRDYAAATLLDLTRIVRVAAVDEAIVLQALALGWTDFEDAVQGMCAIAVGADHFVTRNPTHFQRLTIPIAAPGELLARMSW